MWGHYHLYHIDKSPSIWGGWKVMMRWLMSMSSWSITSSPSFCRLYNGLNFLFPTREPACLVFLWVWLGGNFDVMLKLLQKVKQERREWKFLPRLFGTSLMSLSLLFHYSKLITRNDNFFLLLMLMLSSSSSSSSYHISEKKMLPKKNIKKKHFPCFFRFFLRSDICFFSSLNSHLDSRMYWNVVFLRPSPFFVLRSYILISEMNRWKEEQNREKVYENWSQVTG